MRHRRISTLLTQLSRNTPPAVAALLPDKFIEEVKVQLYNCSGLNALIKVIDAAILGRNTAVMYYRTSAVEYVFGSAEVFW